MLTQCCSWCPAAGLLAGQRFTTTDCVRLFHLREAHEEVGKVLQFCASHARPIYGWLLQATYGQTSSVENYRWLRFVAALLLGASRW